MSLLFEEALQAVPQSDRTILDHLRATHPQATIEDVLSAVQQRRQYCIDAHLKFKRPGGKVIDLQDVFAKVAAWLEKFKTIGDVAVQYDPVHSALPWAALRFLLQAFINDSQSLDQVAEGLEVITKNYSRCALLEKALLRNSATASDLVGKLRTAIVLFYNSTLIYLARASKFYSKNPRLRFLQNTFRATPTLAKELLLITSRVDEVQRYVVDVTAEAVQDQSESMQKLSAQLALFEAPLKRWSPVMDVVNDRLLAEERCKILDWISSVAHQQYHDQQFGEVLPGTATWLQQRAPFIEWQNSSSPALLWLKGSPGWGKTKLASAFIQLVLTDAISSGSHPRIAYFYCSDMNYNNMHCTSAEVLRSIVRQLSVITSQGSICREVQDVYQAHLQESAHEGFPPRPLSINESVDLILRMVGQSTVTVVIDGLDELGQDAYVLSRTLRRLVQEAPSLTKVLVTSRLMEVADFDGLQTMSYVITAEDNKADIRQFVEQETGAAIKEQRLLKGKVSNTTEARIVQDISNGADGMFLWASLQLKNICDNSRFVLEQDVLMSLTTLSKGLLDTFSNILSRILRYEPAARDFTCRVLSWLLAAKRPLTKSELLAACVPSTNENSIMWFHDKGQLLVLCANLIVFDEEQEYFRFIHTSVREYLCSRTEFSSAQIHRLALERCLACYTTDLDETTVTEDNVGPGATQAFHSYACWFWMEHYQEIPPDQRMPLADNAVIHFALGAEGVYFASWLEDVAKLLAEKKTRNSESQRLRAVLSTSGTPIYTAAAYDIPCILESHHSIDVENPVLNRINEPNLDGASPVYICARYGSDKSLQIILRSGGLPNAIGGHMKTPLQAATFWAHTECLEVLLDHGADHNTVGRFPDAPSAALAGGNESSLLLLLRKGCYKGDEVGTILDAAANKGFDQVVKFLSERKKIEKAEVNHDYLQKALAHGSSTAAKIWIKKVSDVNAKYGHYGNAMQAAAFGGNEACVSLLIAAGASIDVKGLYGSPLRAASLKGNHKVVNRLLSHGAHDITAIVAAAQNGHLSTLQILLDAMEGDPEMPKVYPQSLDAASLAGEELVVDMLLTRCGSSQYTAIEQQALNKGLFSGCLAIVNVFNKHYHSMRAISYSGSVQCSVARGPSVIYGIRTLETTKSISEFLDDHFAKTFGILNPFQDGHALDGGDTMRLAARLGDITIIKALLTIGYSAEGHEDSDGNRPRAYPVEIAAAYGHTGALDTFLQHGCKLHRALVFATRFGQIDVVRYILLHYPEIEVDLNPSDFWSSSCEVHHGYSAMYSNNSALALAIDLDSTEIFQVLWDHKLRSESPVPNVSIVRASRNDRIPYVHKILRDGAQWKIGGNSAQYLVYSSKQTTRSNLDSKTNTLANHNQKVPSAEENWFSLLGDGLSAVKCLERSEVATIMEYAIKEAASNGAYRVLKLLLEDELNPFCRRNAIYEAAKIAGKCENFEAGAFLSACSTDGVGAALLVEIVLSYAPLPSRQYDKYAKGGALLLRMLEMVKLVKRLCATDTQFLDLCLSRLCHKTVIRHTPLLAHEILNELNAARKPLHRIPDILHDLLDVVAHLPISQLSHLPSLFELMTRYGADLNSVRNESLLTRVCVRGLTDCFFFMIGQNVQIPEPTETFPIPGRFPQITFGGVCNSYSHLTYDLHSGPKDSVDLLRFTIHAFLNFKEGSRTAWSEKLSAGYETIICFLRNRGYDYNLLDHEFATFCRMICYRRNEVLLAQILEAVKRNMKDNLRQFLNQVGLLHAAVLAGYRDITEYLIDLGADVNHSTTWDFPCKGSHPKQGTPIQIATHDDLHGDTRDNTSDTLSVFQLLIRENVSHLDRQRVFGYAMKVVLREGDYNPTRISGNAESIVSSLLGEGIDLAAAQRVHPYAEVAIQHRRTGWLVQLFDKGFDIETCSEDLIKLAINLGYADMVELLMKLNPADQKLGLFPVIDEVIREGRVHLLPLLKHVCYDINRSQSIWCISGPSCHSLLGKELADSRMDPVKVERILQNGSDPNIIIEGWTPLLILLNNTFMPWLEPRPEQCTKLLLEYGCNPNLPRPAEFEGETVWYYPVHAAVATKNCYNILKALVDAGADMSPDGGFGTPLFYAKWVYPDNVAAILSLAPTALDKPGRFSFVVGDGNSFAFEKGKKYVRPDFRSPEYRIPVKDEDLRVLSLSD